MEETSEGHVQRGVVLWNRGGALESNKCLDVSVDGPSHTWPPVFLHHELVALLSVTVPADILECIQFERRPSGVDTEGLGKDDLGTKGSAVE